VRLVYTDITCTECATGFLKVWVEKTEPDGYEDMSSVECSECDAPDSAFHENFLFGKLDLLVRDTDVLVPIGIIQKVVR
jgi:hypothetical protein